MSKFDALIKNLPAAELEAPLARIGSGRGSEGRGARNNRGSLRLAALLLSLLASQSFAHGNVTPQAMDTKELPTLSKDWQKANPYRSNATAIRIGESGFNQNCARCHGLGAISGGIAPDLRYLPVGDEGDEIFLNRIRHGSARDGRVYMPPFEGILSQEAMWAIRSWLEKVHAD